MEEKTWVTKSSGEQQDFGTGAKRDKQGGKGRFDLIAPYAIRTLAKKYAEYGLAQTSQRTKKIGFAIDALYNCIYKDNIDVFEEAGDALWHILEQMASEYEDDVRYDDLDGDDYRFDLIPYMPIKRIAGVYERGADLYGERNWENGMPLQRLLDSAIRHLFQYKAGKTDEDHAAQGAWNVMAFIETLWRIKNKYLPENLDNRLELKRISDWPLDYEGEEVVEKPAKALFADGYGGPRPIVELTIDGYGSQMRFDEGDFDFSDEAEENRKTLFGQVVGSPQGTAEQRLLKLQEQADKLRNERERFKEENGEYPDLNGLR